MRKQIIPINKLEGIEQIAHLSKPFGYLSFPFR